MNDALQTLKYWFDVEALTAPDAEEDDDKSENHFVTYVRDNVYPWEPHFPSPKQDQQERQYKHFVRFGILARASYDQELLATLRTEAAPDYDSGGRQNTSAFTFLGVFEVSTGGYVQAKTLKMASFAQAFSELKNNQALEFADYSATLIEYFDKEAGRLAEEQFPASGLFIQTLQEKAIQLLKWVPVGIDQGPQAIVVSKATVGKDEKPLTPRIPPINSFFLDDMEAAINSVKNKQPAGLVLPYLVEPSESGRVDSTSIEAIDKKLSLDLLPDGRWPSQFSLTLMQQVAVNEGLRALHSGGLFSLNGPPGTGKTTLLMDVVAAILVERAKILTTFSTPNKAFTRYTDHEVKYPNQPHSANIYKLDARLHGFTMVVTSANNGAVENVTREFPNQSKIDPQYHSIAEYFSPTATALLKKGSDDEESEDTTGEHDTAKAWGLISAVLGNAKNMNRFNSILKAKTKDDKEDFSNIFRQLKDKSEAVDWATARRDFDDALATVSRLKGEMKQVDAISREVYRLKKLADVCEQKYIKAQQTVEEAKKNIPQAAITLKDAEDDLRSADKNAELLQPGKWTGFWAMLPASWAICRSARSRISLFEAAVKHRAQCDILRTSARTNLRALEALVATNTKVMEEAQQERDHARQALSIKSAQLETLRSKRSGLVSFEDALVATDADRQQMLPRMCDALNDARAMLFIKAMVLHRAFLQGAGKVFSQNLSRALGMLTRDPYLTPVIKDVGIDLWATLSLLVPVVSSTFASFARCFEHMPTGGIGWLFVDEAGQAAPQQAVGALARAKRAFIVGDPLQVEPVVTLDKNVDAKLLERHKAPIRHLATATSLQVIADQHNTFGSYLISHQNEPVWVGSPLKVHRRCVEPMFSICNKIAYNQTMVLGRGKVEQESKITTGSETAPPRPLLGPSCWIDMPGTEGCEKHHIPAQAHLALDLVKSYMQNGWVNPHTELPDLYIISPFKTAAAGMRELLKKTQRDWADHITVKNLTKWVNQSVGTVHTFQGKEAESVIFLLGGSTSGAIEWAASTPNILNVGVSRAQRRLYIIGDWNAWRKHDLVRNTMGIEGWPLSRDAALKRLNVR